MKGALIFLTVSFCLLFAFGYAPSSHHQQRECAKVSQSEILSLGATFTDRDKTANQANNKAKKEYEDKRDFAATCSDLAAQWSVANYTHKAFWLGLIGLGFLGWTLFETQDAAKSARKATTAAFQAVAAAKDATRAELQPYISISQIRVQHIQGSDDIDRELFEDGKKVATHFYRANGEIIIPCEVTVANTGKVPALDLMYLLSAELSLPERTATGFTTHKFLIRRQMSMFKLQLAANDDTILKLQLRFNCNDFFEDNEGLIEMPAKGLRMDIGLRINWRDRFSFPKRRVYTAFADSVLTKGSIEWGGEGEGKAEEYDSPDFWNKRDGMIIPLAIFGGGTLKNLNPKNDA